MMQVQEPIQFTLQREPVTPAELEYMAFTGQYEWVYAIFKRIPAEEKPRYANKYVYSQVVWGGLIKLRKFLAVHKEASAEREKAFIDAVVREFIAHRRQRRDFPRELFETLLYWSDELVQLVLPAEAMHYIEEALEMGCSKFPALQLQFLSRMARIANDRGNLHEAFRILGDLAQRPYLLTDRNLVPEILFDLSQTALKIGETGYYKKLIFMGLHYFYTDTENRRAFVEQITTTYRRWYCVLWQRDVPAVDRLLFAAHWLYFKLPDFGRVRLGILNKLMQLGVLGTVYAVNYLRSGSNPALFEPPARSAIIANGRAGNGQQRPAPRRRSRKRNILITRAMGGIGDLLMMTPGLHALAQKYPGEEIVLALPRRYFAVFQGNPDVRLVDIEKTRLSPGNFRRWFNFTDCPAARVEARTAPKVKKSRIEIFAAALGVGPLTRLRMDKTPRYTVLPEETAFRDEFWQRHGLNGRPVIGVQLQADETYRNYPHMEALVQALSRRATVLIFDGRPIEGFDFPNVIKVDRYALREAFALASGCDLLVAPDSAFVHLSAALNIPCVALFGPIDGRVRTRDYPLCEFIDVRTNLGCVPCWRNEAIPCKLTNMRTSVCMADIEVAQVVNTIEQKLIRRKHHASL
jgi:ADP-heptose:LPS heptosyltransferase